MFPVARVVRSKPECASRRQAVMITQYLLHRVAGCDSTVQATLR
jgi:hypothetical protein